MMASTSQRSLAGRIANDIRWSRVHGADARRRATAPALAGRNAKLAAQVLVEAGRELTEEELDAAVARLRRAQALRAAAASAVVRRGGRPK